MPEREERAGNSSGLVSGETGTFVSAGRPGCAGVRPEPCALPSPAGVGVTDGPSAAAGSLAL
jgi:hypothetical protein